jgi:hypothetical protein
LKAVITSGVALGLGFAALVLPARAQAPNTNGQSPLEYPVKAAYLAKFAPFIEWPTDAFAAPTAPLVICVVGRDPLGTNLDRAVQGQKDREHPLTVRRLVVPDPEIPCHILFVADAGLADATLESARMRPLVTVTEAGPSAQGIISFVRVGNTVRFDIDVAAAQAVGLSISSKLLSLARTVRRSPR